MFHDSHVVKNELFFKSINLVVGVILCHISPKSLPLGMLLFVVLANDPSYLFVILVEEVFISSLISSKQFFSVSGRLSPHNFEMFSISPLQACAFRCWFSNNSVQFFFARMLSKPICGRSWHFLLHSVIPMIYLLFFLPEALWRCSFHSPSRFVRIVFFSCLSI